MARVDKKTPVVSRILLIEDDEDNALIIRGLLNRRPDRFQVDWADSVSQGLERLSAGGANLVLLDLSLPDSDGIDTFRRVREHDPSVAIVILTSNDDDKTASQAVHEGAQDYLLKWEINERMLVRAVNYALERNHSEQELRQAHDQLEMLVKERTAELQATLERSQWNEKELQRQHRELATLHTMTAAISATLDIERVLSTLARLLKEQMEIPAGNLYFFDPAQDELVSRIGWGMPDHLLTYCQRQPVAGCHAEVISTRKARHWEDFRDVPHLKGMRLEQSRPDWQSYLCVPLVALGKIRGTLEIFSAKPQVFTSEQLPFFTALGQQIGVAIQNASIYEVEQQARRNSQKLTRRLVEAQEAERRRLARELHDEAGQIITGLKLTLETIEDRAPEYLKEQLGQASRIVQELSTQIREISHSLRPTMLDDLGLLPTIVSHCARFTDRTGVKVSFKHRGLEERRFAPEIETAAYRIMQEAMNNIAKYAEVKESSLHVIVSEEALFLQIADRGRGFDLDEAGALATNGLRGMRERAELLGGKLRIDANPGAGVTVTVNLPLGSDQHPHEQNLIRQNQEGASRLPPPPQLIAAL